MYSMSTRNNKLPISEILRFEKQPYHIVENSPWPFIVSIMTLLNVLNLVLYMHRYRLELIPTIVPAIMFIYALSFWFHDIIIESFSHHTIQVYKSLRLGFQLFIISEVMFFFAFFWAFFHLSTSPSIWIGAIWPPKGINVINPWALPLFNTILLLSSGVSLTLSHAALVSHDKRMTIHGLVITLLLAANFILCQVYEYKNAYFSIYSSAYGSTFYMMTGFHGFHVIVGFIFLTVALFRTASNHFSTTRHLGFEFAAWYWHFADVVRIFLRVCVYLWGS